jgi:hypothetical protein
MIIRTLVAPPRGVRPAMIIETVRAHASKKGNHNLRRNSIIRFNPWEPTSFDYSLILS